MPLDPARRPDQPPLGRPPRASVPPVLAGPPGPNGVAGTERWRWAGLLEARSRDWLTEASRLRALVRSSGLTGPCAAALVALGDAIASDMAAAATQVARMAASDGLAPGGVP